MLADAIRAEGFRLSKNRVALFWSLAFVPLLTVVFGALGSLFMKASEKKLTSSPGLPPQVQELLLATPMNLAETLVKAAESAANPGVLMFVAIGAATLYAGDYRWETWRLISARNARPNLILGKVGVLCVLALIAVLIMTVGNLIESLIRAGVFNRSLTFAPTGEHVGDFFGLLGLSWLRVVQFAMLGLLAAVTTRSLLAALFAPLAIGVAQAISPQLLLAAGVMPTDWIAVLLNPGSAFDILKGWIDSGGGEPAVAGDLLAKAVASFALWTLIPLAAALAWFERQDLSKE